MEYRENGLTYEEYIALRDSVGWYNFAEEQVSKSIKNSIYDIVVKPEYQGKGVGSKIIDKLLTYVDTNTPIGGRSSVQLIFRRVERHRNKDD